MSSFCSSKIDYRYLERHIDKIYSTSCMLIGDYFFWDWAKFEETDEATIVGGKVCVLLICCLSE